MLARERRAMLKRRAQRQELADLRDTVQIIGYGVDSLDSQHADLQYNVSDLERDIDSLRSDVEDLQ